MGICLCVCFCICGRGFRFRVCQLVAKLLGEATDSKCKMSSGILNRIQEVMLQRVQDKVTDHSLSGVINVCMCGM